jgi:FtsH-binding integral membrane protein
MKKTITTTIATLLAASPVYAATSQASHSGILTWAFLGLCGLIVATQLVPSTMLLIGIAKGLKSKEVSEH